MKKYMDIVRLGHKTTVGVLSEGDYIVIQEKLDGANASFKREGDVIKCFSRNNELDEHNTLRGFYQFVQEHLNVNLLDERYIYFGEWLVKHKIAYDENAMNNFYLFDIYDTETGEYLDNEVVEKVAVWFNLRLVPVFYRGEYKDFDHLMSFVGKSHLGEVGEGVVVKKVDYRDRWGNQVFVKLVSDEFREVQKQKAPKDPNAPQTPEQMFVSAFVTPARIEKFLHKFVDEGILDEQFGIEDMGTILKHMNGRIYEDLLKEESESLPQDCDEKELKKSISRTIALEVKKIVLNRQQPS